MAVRLGAVIFAASATKAIGAANDFMACICTAKDHGQLADAVTPVT